MWMRATRARSNLHSSVTLLLVAGRVLVMSSHARTPPTRHVWKQYTGTKMATLLPLLPAGSGSRHMASLSTLDRAEPTTTGSHARHTYTLSLHAEALTDVTHTGWLIWHRARAGALRHIPCCSHPPAAGPGRAQHDRSAPPTPHPHNRHGSQVTHQSQDMARRWQCKAQRPASAARR